MNDELIKQAAKTLQDKNESICIRFRALFTLRNFGNNELAVCSIKDTMKDEPSALLKHECAYCLGQMDAKAATEYLIALLKDESENPMVRHEAGEALALLLEDDRRRIVEDYVDDSDVLVRETCRLAVKRILSRKDTL
ncbi:hypothetical protein ACOME3_005417 [Neoechinorhynchus agilis]